MPLNIKRPGRKALTLSLMLALSGCIVDMGERSSANVDDDDDKAKFAITTDLFDDMKRIDLADLFWGTGRLASDELNDWLAEIPFADIRVSETQLYGAVPEGSYDLTMNDVEEMSAGVAERFGEDALPTEVNRIRARQVEEGKVGVYAESNFRLGVNFDPVQKREVLGLGPDINTGVSVGFIGGAGIEASVVRGYAPPTHVDLTTMSAELNAIIANPIRAAGEHRNWVFPRTLGDVREHMAPGESFALKKDGRLGFNYGFGMPIFLSNPVAELTYNVVVSAGAGVVASGELDVQLVRMEGAEAVIDIGLRKAKVENVYLAIEDGFGLAGLERETGVSFAGLERVDMPVGSIVERALVRELNRRISIISGRAEHADGQVRESVARFRVNLASENPKVGIAVQQALLGDIRAAQMMAHQDDPDIRAELDVQRAGRTVFGTLGFRFLGMGFGRTTETAEGEVTVQTPDGYLAAAFNSSARDRELFFSSRGHTRTLVSGIEHTVEQGTTTAQTNMAYSWSEGDRFMERDALADHLDGYLANVLGHAAYAPIAKTLGLMGRDVQRVCGREDRRPTCPASMLNHPAFARWTDTARTATTAAMTAAQLDQLQAEQTMGIFDLNAAAHRSYQNPGLLPTLTGPSARIEIGTRLSDEALRVIAGRTGQEVRQAIESTLALTRQDRGDQTGMEEEIAELRERGDSAKLNAIADLFDANRRLYNAFDGAPVADNALIVDFQVDRANNPVLNSVVVGTPAQRRVQAIGKVVDDMVASIGRLGTDGGGARILGYTLLGLVPANLRDVRVDIQMELDEDWEETAFQAFYNREYDMHLWQKWTRGSGVRLLGDGIGWDVDQLVDVDTE